MTPGNDPPAARPPLDDDEGLRRRGGIPVKEYEARVWDMARHLLHPSAVYVAACVAGGVRLLGHPVFDEGAAGAAIELAMFLSVFLGGWACVLSTLMRDAGLPSATITVLAPLAAASAVAVWTVFPAPSAPGRDPMPGALLAAALALQFAPGAPAFAVTWTKWRRLRKEHLPA
ncbi:MAG: hypothetical protein HMLKMBBP_01440 [Planctomycetes bacterium]|nr:hypothetical protein [Planctomycetota bacterium]